MPGSRNEASSVPPDSLSTTRRRNALRLFREFADAYRRSVDEALVDPAPSTGALPQGATIGSLRRQGVEAAFAEQLQIKPSSWSMARNGTRPIGDKLARQIEASCSKPPGWLDVPREDEQLTESEARFLAAALEAWRETNADGRRRLRQLLQEFKQGLPTKR